MCLTRCAAGWHMKGELPDMGPCECPATCFFDDHNPHCLCLSWQELGFADWRCRCTPNICDGLQALALCKGEAWRVPRDDKFPKGVRRDERPARLRPLGIRRLASGSRIQKRSRCPNSLCLSVGAAVSRLPSMRLIFSAASVTMSPPVTKHVHGYLPSCTVGAHMLTVEYHGTSETEQRWSNVMGSRNPCGRQPPPRYNQPICHHYQPWHCRTAVGRPSYAYGIIDLVRRRSRLISLHLWAAGLQFALGVKDLLAVVVV